MIQPVGSSPRFWAVGPPAAALLLALYVMTAAPGAWWGDGLELAAAARTLGVPHPTGYPLYMMLGRLTMAVMAWMDAGRALTLFSSVLCAASALLIGRLVFNQVGGRAAPSALESASLSETAVAGLPAMGFAAGAMLLVGLSRTLWEHATFAEVYPLTLLLGTAIVTVAAAPSSKPAFARTAVLALAWGLATLNHYSIVALGPLVLLCLIQSTRRSARHLLIFIAIWAACLLGYLYLPLRASANPPINWGDPSSPGRLLWVLRGGDYVALNAAGGGSAAQQLLGWLAWWGRQLLPEPVYAAGWLPGRLALMGSGAHAAISLGVLVLVGGVGGCLLIARRRPAFGLGLVFSFPIAALFAVMYPIPDIDAYFLPALPAAALGWAECFRVAYTKIPRTKFGTKRRAALGAIPLAAGLLLAPAHYRAVDKSWDDGPRRWAEAVLDALPPDSIVLTREKVDSEIYALWYEQIVNGLRPDVTVLGRGFIFSGWYARYFESEGRPHPPLFIRQRELGSKAVFNDALVGGVIVPNLGRRRVFSTYVDRDADFRSRYPYITAERVAELLPVDYYVDFAYRFTPPSRALFEIHADPDFAEDARQKFIDRFGEPPPREDDR